MNRLYIKSTKTTTEVCFCNAINALDTFDFSKRKVVIFASKKAENFTNELVKYFEKKSVDVFSYQTSDGEQLKTIEKALLFTNYLSLNHIGRDDIIINVGGGTICDTGAFVASLYMRGISYINIPTTLLCAVDASIGGKTAVDYSGNKNLWGTFHQPEKVICDCDLILKSGSDVIAGGLSEVVKYGIIDRDFGIKLLDIGGLSGIEEHLEEVIESSLKIKAHYVEIDEFDRNERHALNLGHTVAHAIESASSYKTSHGEAVATGLFKESRLAFKLGILSAENLDFIINLCNCYLSESNIDKEDLIKYMENDKKNRDEKIAFSLPSDSGIKTIYLSKEDVLNNL